MLRSPLKGATRRDRSRAVLELGGNNNKNLPDAWRLGSRGGNADCKLCKLPTNPFLQPPRSPTFNTTLRTQLSQLIHVTTVWGRGIARFVTTFDVHEGWPSDSANTRHNNDGRHPNPRIHPPKPPLTKSRHITSLPNPVDGQGQT